MSHHMETMAALPTVGPLPVNKRLRLVLVLSVLVGTVTFLVALAQEPTRAWYNYLLNYFYWMSLGLAGVFFVALQHVTGALWSVTLRRIGESLIAFLPVALLLLFGVIGGMYHLYGWTQHDVVHHSLLLAKKTGFLNPMFFTMRNISAMLLWLLFGWFLVRNSLLQDTTRDARLSHASIKYSAIFILLFAVTYTLISFDLMMSLEAEWFSTIFGVYCFAGLFLSGIAMMTLIAVPLYRKGRFGPYVNAENHLFDLGKWMLAFTVFWAYIAFSQYLLIWYADLPEETFYYIARTTGGWANVSWALLWCNFVIPFIVLLPSQSKKRPGFLLGVAVWILATHYLDLYWMVVPVFERAGPVFGATEIGIFMGFAGLFGLAVTTFLHRVPLVAIGDPRLLDGVNFHQLSTDDLG